MPTMTKMQSGLTFPWPPAISSPSLLAHGFGGVMYLPASKRQVAGANQRFSIQLSNHTRLDFCVQRVAKPNVQIPNKSLYSK